MKIVAVTFAVLAFATTAPTFAYAADTQIVVAGTDPQTVHSKLVQAAERVCSQARASDPFDDFGSQQECVENTLDYARVTHRSYQPVYSQAQPQR
jgi:hypothetical protein